MSALRMSLRFQISRGIPVLGVAGDLDLSTASSLRDACLSLVRLGHHVLVVDLQSVAPVPGSRGALVYSGAGRHTRTETCASHPFGSSGTTRLA